MDFGDDIDMLKPDLSNSRKLFIVDEKDSRAELLTLREQHQQAQMNPEQSIKTPYIYKDSDRFHLFEASSENLSEKFHNLKGDYLKDKILNVFKDKLEKTSSKEELDTLVKEFKSSDEFKTLEKGQGLTTRIFGLKTSSIEAFEEMVRAQETNIEKSTKHP